MIRLQRPFLNDPCKNYSKGWRIIRRHSCPICASPLRRKGYQTRLWLIFPPLHSKDLFYVYPDGDVPPLKVQYGMSVIDQTGPLSINEILGRLFCELDYYFYCFCYVAMKGKEAAETAMLSTGCQFGLKMPRSYICICCESKKDGKNSMCHPLYYVTINHPDTCEYS